MGQESRNIKQILYGDLILTLNHSNLPWQRFSHPCQDHCGLGIFPGWLSSMQWPKDSILSLYNFSTQLPQTLPKGKREMGKAHCLSIVFAWKLVTCIQSPLARTSHRAPTQLQRRMGRVRECMHILWALTASVIMLLLLKLQLKGHLLHEAAPLVPFQGEEIYSSSFISTVLWYTSQ